jgi:hypothetical protein
VDTRTQGAPTPNGPRADHSTGNALSHFRKVISDSWHRPSEEHATAKRRLDFLCGHIDRMPNLLTPVPFAHVAAHYTALHGAGGTAFTRDLACYLTLIGADLRPGAAEFTGASVALTFDRARHEANILRFVDDGQALARVLTREGPSPLL